VKLPVHLTEKRLSGRHWEIQRHCLRLVNVVQKEADREVICFVGVSGEPGRNRTFNQQIKSLLLCQLSYGPTRVLAVLTSLCAARPRAVAYGWRRDATLQTETIPSASRSRQRSMRPAAAQKPRPDPS
jgi:hypothetical protein